MCTDIKPFFDFLGWTFCAAAIGVAIGYVVGGQTLSLFVDINTVDLSRSATVFTHGYQNLDFPDIYIFEVSV